MNQPFYPFHIPNPQEQQQEMEKRQLRKDAAYIGTLSIALTLAMEFTFTILAMILLAFGVLTPDQLADPYLELGNTVYMLLYSGVYVFALLVPTLIVSFAFKKRFMPFAPAKPTTFGVGFLGILAAVGMCMFSNIVNSYILTFFSEMGLSVPDVPQTMENTPISLVINLFTMAVLPALLEEMIYRGYILRTLRPYGNWFAVIVSSMLFGLMHGNLRQVPFAFIVGLVLGVLYVVTDNIWMPIAVHFCNNAISVLMEYFGFSLAEDYVGFFYAIVIYGLVFVGIVAAIILFVSYKKHIAVPKVNTSLSATKRTAVLFSVPLFLLSVVVYVVLLFMGS